MQVDKVLIEAFLLLRREKSSEVLEAQRARMQQTHAVRHRQYTLEEKSRRSFCPKRRKRKFAIDECN